MHSYANEELDEFWAIETGLSLAFLGFLVHTSVDDVKGR